MRRELTAAVFYAILTLVYMLPLTYYGLPWLSVRFTAGTSAVIIFLVSAVVYYSATAGLKNYLIEIERSVIAAGAVATVLTFALFAGGVLLIEDLTEFVLSESAIGSGHSEGMSGILMLSTLAGIFAGYLGAASERVSLKDVFDLVSEV